MPSRLDGRGEELYKALAEIMHLYLGETARDADEYESMHATFYTGFVAALNYCGEYPKQAMKLLDEVRRHALADRHRLTTDQVMAHITDELYPSGAPEDSGDRLLQIAKDYGTKHEAGTEHVKPVLIDGALRWESTAGKPPFPGIDEFGPWDWGE